MSTLKTDPKLTVYKASAGSGKTFRLVVEYLKLVLVDVQSFRTIQALTFTNKATTEMKERIFLVLYDLSNGGADGYIQILRNELKLDETEIRQKAKEALSIILHDYHHFSVSTIDRFFQTILRAFAHESGIFGNFSVELDDALILEEAVDRVHLMTDDHDDIREWLIQTSEEQLKDGKNWNTHDVIRKMGGQLLREINLDLFNQLSENNIGEVKALKEELYKTKKCFETFMASKSKVAIDLMTKHGLTIDQFSGKKRSFVNYFYKCIDPSGKKDRFVPTKSTLAAVDNIEKWVTKTAGAGLKNQMEQLYGDGFNQCLNDLIEYQNQNFTQYISALLVIKNIHSLGLTMYLYQCIREIQNERNVLLLGEGNRLLHALVGEQDAPFIFEKTGAFVNHFMVDEFQDTSTVQWDILRPLVDNALASNYENILVGDVKQSIYRWRNGDWRILSQRIYQNFQHYGINDQVIDSNFRSSVKIVEFNNDFFKCSASKLQNKFINDIEDSANRNALMEKYGKIIENAYADIKQNSRSGFNGGCVQLMPVNDEKDIKTKMFREVVKEVEKLQGAGWDPSDICVLVRTNSDGQEVITALMEAKNERPVDGVVYNFSTADSLRLNNAISNRFIMLFLAFFINPESTIAQHALLHVFAEYIHPALKQLGALPDRFVDDEKDQNDLFNVQEESIESSYFPFFTTQNPWLESLRILTPLLLINEIIRRYNLWRISSDQAAVQALCDKVSALRKRDLINVFDVVEWWNASGFKTSFDPGGNQNAIKIMTIHKSKGLQFPWVIIPSNEWKLLPKTGNANSLLIWCKSGYAPFNKVDFVPVEYASDMGKSVFVNEYLEENLMSYVDNLNLLYVAFTRAVHGLSVFFDGDTKAKQNADINTVSDLFKDYIRNNGDAETYTIGDFNLIEKSESTSSASDSYMVAWHMAREKCKMNLRSQNAILQEDDHEHPLTKGRILHELFSYIKTKDDVSLAIKKILVDGLISKAEVDSIKKIVLKALDFVDERAWFSKKWRVLNETSILAPGTIVRRPDRVMINEKQAIVIDYKTGEKNAKYRYQLLTYLRLLKEMGYEVKAYLWYILNDEIEEVRI